MRFDDALHDDDDLMTPWTKKSYVESAQGVRGGNPLRGGGLRRGCPILSTGSMLTQTVPFCCRAPESPALTVTERAGARRTPMGVKGVGRDGNDRLAPLR